MIEPDAESLGYVGGHPRAGRARIEHEAKWPAAIDPHRSPDPPDPIAQGGGNKARFGRLNHDFRKLVVWVRLTAATVCA